MLRRGIAVALWLCLWACDAPTSSPGAAGLGPVVLREAVSAPSPADPKGASCADVGAHRVCWVDGAARVGLRPLPAGGVSAGGIRCGGQGDSRGCTARRQNAGPFVCEGTRCVQRYPRFPDDGEWECTELDGVTVCHGGAPPAAIPEGPPDLGWSCGTRTGVHRDERVCVDLAPDTPAEPATDWSCQWSHEGGEQRVCVRRTATAIGVPCRSAGDCPDQARCTGGICVPARFEPACWFAWDCGRTSLCRFGTCFEGH